MTTARQTLGDPGYPRACPVGHMGSVRPVLRARDWPGDADLAKVAAGSWHTKDRDAISSSGYVLHTLEAALWCVDRTGSMEEALILAANLAGDADTVAAVTGQLAGALWGTSGIPAPWLAKLAWRDKIESLATELYEAAKREQTRSVDPAGLLMRGLRVRRAITAGGGGDVPGDFAGLPQAVRRRDARDGSARGCCRWR